jgi:hypothetical protein
VGKGNARRGKFNALAAFAHAELSADLPTCGKKDVDALERRGHDSAI